MDVGDFFGEFMQIPNNPYPQNPSRIRNNPDMFPSFPLTIAIVFGGIWWTCSGELIHLVKLLVRRVMIAKQQPEGCFVFRLM